MSCRREETFMGLIYDILVILIIAYVIYTNAKRGFGKVLVFGIGYIVATLLASVLAGVAAPSCYEVMARDSNLAAIHEANEHVDFTEVYLDMINEQDYGFTANKREISDLMYDIRNGEFDDRLYQFVIARTGESAVDQEAFRTLIRQTFTKVYGAQLEDRMPEYVCRDFEKSVEAKPQLMRDMMRACFDRNQSPDEIAEKIEDLFSAETTTEVIQILLYLILFSILMVIAAFIGSMLQNKMFFNIRNTTDHVLGGMIGILEAGVMITLLTLIVRLIVLLTGEKTMMFSESTINSSMLFSFFYHNIRILL